MQVWALVLMMALGIAELSPAERGQVATAVDRSERFDEAALYPLLHDALRWEPGEETGARVPDYAAIVAAPAEQRGALFLIEGQLVSFKPVGALARPGPWDSRLEQWGLKWGTDEGDVAIVYLADPPAGARLGQQVRMPARFYKLWTTPDRQGRSQTFVTFVGRSARRADGRPWTGPQRGPAGFEFQVLTLVAAMGCAAVAFFFVLRRVRRLSRFGGSREPVHRPRPAPAAPPAEPAVALPEDPAAALDMLERQHEESPLDAPAYNKETSRSDATESRDPTGGQS